MDVNSDLPVTIYWLNRPIPYLYATEMNTQENDKSLNLLARIAGALYLIVIAGGIFSEVFVRQKLFVFGDATATAVNILENENLYRWGFAIGIFYLLCNIPLVLIYHELFKSVNRLLTLLLVFLFLTANAIEIFNMIFHFLPLDLLDAGTSINELGREKSIALAYMALVTHSTGFSISLVFFGCCCFLIGYLIYQSDFLPRILGILMMIAGLCYLTDSFLTFLAPELAKSLFPFILMPCFVAELSFATWLLIKGVKLTPGMK